jgi:hypothetical protein
MCRQAEQPAPGADVDESLAFQRIDPESVFQGLDGRRDPGFIDRPEKVTPVFPEAKSFAGADFARML